ncbi:transmembrane protein 273-like [Latimeria chalumnae]|uniref:transmembrane protein 273-like n=1 Tax=Latimeria chalumnae TaxID=7897 RepID=UPI00313C156B
MTLPLRWATLTTCILFLLDCLSAKVYANGTKDDLPDIKYALIGAGIGAFLAICFLALKFYMIKRNLLELETTDSESMKMHSIRPRT